MKKNIKYIILVISIIIILIAFFFPKLNNILENSLTSNTPLNMACSCIGFKDQKIGLTKSGTEIQFCYGLPVDCKCYNNINENKNYIPCK